MRTLSSLTGVNVLGAAQKKQIKGSGVCGVNSPTLGWIKVGDLDGDGRSKDDAIDKAAEFGYHWCCDSCPWNQ